MPYESLSPFDLLFAKGDTGPWVLCEPQRQIDAAKRTAWASLVALLNAEFIAEGKAEGLRETLFAAIATKGFALTAETRERVDACTDPSQLQRWVLNTMTATTLREIW